MTKFKEEEDYRFVIPEDEKTTVGIKLLKGPYKDVVYQYGKVKFEEEKDGAVYLRFVYNVVESPYEKSYLEKNQDDFKNYIGDLLVGIIQQNLDKGLMDEAGTDYIEESDSK